MLTTQLPAGAIGAARQAGAFRVNSAPPLITAPAILSGAAPVFVIVRLLEAAVPTGTPPNAIGDGDSAKPGGLPVPESASVCRLPGAFEVTVNVAACGPPAVGA